MFQSLTVRRSVSALGIALCVSVMLAAAGCGSRTAAAPNSQYYTGPLKSRHRVLPQPGRH